MKFAIPKLPSRENRQPDPPGVTIPQALPDGAKAASWIAYYALMYFLWLRVLAVSKAQFETLQFTHFGAWVGTLALYFPLIIGYVFVVIGVPYVAKIAIPILVSLKWKEHPYPKGWALFITLLVSIVLITGTATVGSDALIESQRGSAVATAQVRQQAAVLQGRITAKEAELKSMMENSNAYLAQAASVGAAEWQRSYIDKTERGDPQRERIVRALGAARAADAIRSDLAGLRAEAATQTVAESVSSEVKSAKTDALSAILGPLNAFWVLLLAMVMDIVCLLMPWIAMRLQQTRDRQLAEAGPQVFTTGLALADKTDEVNAGSQKVYEAYWDALNRGKTAEEARAEVADVLNTKAPAQKAVDKETGETLDYVEVKSFMRRKPKTKKSERKDDMTEYETPAIFGGDPRVAANAADEAAEAQAAMEKADGIHSENGRDDRDDNGAVHSDELASLHGGAPVANSIEDGAAAVQGDASESETLNAQPEENSVDENRLGGHERVSGFGGISGPAYDDDRRADDDAVLAAPVVTGAEGHDVEPLPVTAEEAADKVLAGEWHEVAPGEFMETPHEESGPVIPAHSNDSFADKFGLPSPEVYGPEKPRVTEAA